MKKIIMATVALVAVTGCATSGSPLTGTLYSDVQHGQVATTTTSSSRTGTACAQSFLGAVALGDASIQAAKSAGQISNVSSVDAQSMNILGFYAKYCTIVKGN